MRWRLLAATGMRRGEALALRWRTSTWTPAGSRPAAASASSAEGAGERLVEGTTKTGRSRVVDLDAGTVTALHAYRAAC
jgi:integrase